MKLMRDLFQNREDETSLEHSTSEQLAFRVTRHPKHVTTGRAPKGGVKKCQKVPKRTFLPPPGHPSAFGFRITGRRLPVTPQPRTLNPEP